MRDPREPAHTPENHGSKPGKERLSPETSQALNKLSERGLEPPRDLWPAIAAELKPLDGRHLGRGIRLSLVAAAVVFLVLSIPVWRAMRSPHSDTWDLPGQRSASDLPLAVNAELRQAFGRYLQQRRELLATVERELPFHPADLQTEVRRNIEVIEDAMRQIEHSLSSLNSTANDERQLAALYERELRVLRQVGNRLGESPAWISGKDY